LLKVISAGQGVAWLGAARLGRAWQGLARQGWVVVGFFKCLNPKLLRKTL
jgi:hypothetical protein